MKRETVLLLCLGLLLHTGLCAQHPPLAFNLNKAAKPLLFSSLPEKSDCDFSALQKLFAMQIGESFNIQLSSQLLLKGKIVEKIQQNPGTISINIRAENYNNALFNLSIRLLADNSVAIQGRVVHPKFGDALVLYKENGQYFIKKLDQRLYMPE